MVWTVEAESGLAERIARAAKEANMEPAAFLLESARLRLMGRQGVSVGIDSESTLMERISQGIPSSLRERRLALLDKRDASGITKEEEAELFDIQEKIDNINVEIWRSIGELARRKGKDLSDMAKTLNVAPVELRN
jgi:predicted transcriptional regulator